MKLRRLLYFVILTAARTENVSAAPVEAADETRPKRNVLFLVSDDLRTDLGCYGNTIIKSPNIDRLAERGMVFSRAYCQQAVCSPSRTSVLTGARPDTTRVWDLKTHFRKALPDVVTLPQHFKDNGYITRGLGKIYHGGFDDPQSWSPRDRTNVRRNKGIALDPLAWTEVQGGRSHRRDAPDGRSEETRARRADLAESDSDRETSSSQKSAPRITTRISTTPPIETAGNVTRTDRGPAFRVSDDPPDGGGEGELADEAIDTLREFKDRAEPFFLAVGFHKPHLPFYAPKIYWDMYDAAKIPLASNPFLPQGAPDYSLVEKAEVWSYSGVPDVPDLPADYARQMKHGYYAAVSYMDAQLGRVLDELDSLGLSDNTIVILWGDHGWKLGEHGRWAKHSNVENDAHAPLIISAPEMKAAGKKCSALVEFVDMYPSLAELAGLPKPAHLEGTSFAPLLNDPQQPWKTAAFSQYPRTANGRKLMGYTMRTDRYRFTRWVDRDDHSRVDAVELYDHQSDPEENTNIADDSTNAELIATLTRQWLAGWKGAIPNDDQR